MERCLSAGLHDNGYLIFGVRISDEQGSYEWLHTMPLRGECKLCNGTGAIVVRHRTEL